MRVCMLMIVCIIHYVPILLAAFKLSALDKTRVFLTLDLGHANNLPFAESGFLCKLWQHLVWLCNALV